MALQRLGALASVLGAVCRIPGQRAAGAGLRQGGEELALEDGRQRLHGEEEAFTLRGLDPCGPGVRVAGIGIGIGVGVSGGGGGGGGGRGVALFGRRARIEPAQAPAGHQGVHVHVAAQVLRPGVQHEGEGADGAEPAWVGGKLAQGRRDAAQHGLVEPARMRSGQRVELVRQREHQVAVGQLQQLGQPRGAPGLALTRLALGAGAVATGVVLPARVAAAVALQPLAAQGAAAAAEDVAPRARLRRAELMLAQVLRPEVPQHIGKRQGHAAPRYDRSVRERGGCGAGVVQWRGRTPAR